MDSFLPNKKTKVEKLSVSLHKEAIPLRRDTHRWKIQGWTRDMSFFFFLSVHPADLYATDVCLKGVPFFTGGGYRGRGVGVEGNEAISRASSTPGTPQTPNP